MVEANKKNTETLPEHLQVKAKEEMTRGEKFFDFFTYKVINFGFNYSLSMVIQDLFLGGTKNNHNEPLSYFAEKAGKGSFGKFARKGADWLHKTHTGLTNTFGKTVADLFSLNMGGHFAAIIVYQLNRSKVALTKKFDRMIDGFTRTQLTDEEKEKREERYETLEKEDKPSALKVTMGRISGMLFNMVFYDALERVDKLTGLPATAADENGENGKRSVRRLTQWLGDGFEKDVAKPTDSPMRKKRMKYWPEIMAYDLICTWSTSAVLETIVKFNFKKKKDEPAETKTDAVATKTETGTEATAASDNTTAPRGAKTMAAATTSRFYEEETAEKKRWANKSKANEYGHHEEHTETVGISI